MADRLSTKDHNEREDEEADRLVRPNPKLKPPRRDLRRERMETDRDPDMSNRDDDLSLNYKGKSASIVESALLDFFVRIAKTDSFQEYVDSKRFKNEKGNDVKFDSLSDQEKERERQKWERVHGPVEDDEAPTKPRVKDDEPKKSPADGKPTTGPSWYGDKSPEFFTSAGQQLREAIKGNPALEDVLRIMTTEGQTLHSLAKAELEDRTKPSGSGRAMKLPADKVLPGVQLPEGVETLGDLFLAVTHSAPKTAPSPEKKQPKKKSPKTDQGIGAEPEQAPTQPADKPSRWRVTPTTQPEAPGPVPTEPARTEVPPTQTETLYQQPAPVPAAPAPAQPVQPGATTPSGEAPGDKPKSKPKSEPKKEEPKTEKPESSEKPPRPEDFDKLIKDDDFYANSGKKVRERMDKDPKFGELVGLLFDPKSHLGKLVNDKDGKHTPLLTYLPKDIVPKGIDTVGDLYEAVKKSSPKASEIPEPQRPKPTKRENAEAYEILMALPPPLIKRFGALHPHDLKKAIELYETERASAQHVKNPTAYLKKFAEEGYQTDPTKVKAPKTGTDSSGKEVPFEALSPSRQAEVMQEHRLRVVARSLAAKQVAYATIRKTGAPKTLAKRLVESTLKGKAGDPADTFEETLAEGAAMTPKKAERLLNAFKDDEGARSVILNHVQAGNYLEARQKYLQASSPDRISEHDKPKDIYRKLRTAIEEIQRRTRELPDDAKALDPAPVFRLRVLSSLKQLNPTKYAEVRRLIDEDEAHDYDLKMQRYREAEKRLSDGTYRDKVPEKPARPAGYWNVREMSDEDRKAHQDALKSHRKNLGLDERRKQREEESEAKETDRLKGKPTKKPGLIDKLRDKWKGRKTKSAGVFSSYGGPKLSMALPTCSCGDSCACGVAAIKSAMYHGIEPYPKGHEGFEPYKSWSQAHQCELSEADQGKLLTAARKWLKEPVLAGSDWHPDAKLRAALDLAVYAADGGKYNGAITANLYNQLLSQLAGTGDEPLMTVQPKTATKMNSITSTNVSEESMKASQEIREMATKVASENPSLSFDLLGLAERVAASEKAAADQNKKWMDEAAKGLAQGDKTNKQLGKEAGEMPPQFKENAEKKKEEAAEKKDDKSQDKSAGEMPPQFKENAEKKKEEAEEKKDDKKEASTEKFAALKSAVIKAASSSAEAKQVMLPVLQTLKQLG